MIFLRYLYYTYFQKLQLPFTIYIVSRYMHYYLLFVWNRTKRWKSKQFSILHMIMISKLNFKCTKSKMNFPAFIIISFNFKSANITDECTTNFSWLHMISKLNFQVLTSLFVDTCFFKTHTQRDWETRVFWTRPGK